MEQTKIYVCCHKESFVPKHALLQPIQVGAALAEKRFDGFVHDDEGENISALNRSYCELTAQYWAWKNSPAEHIGFFHYRRYLYPEPEAKRAYCIKSAPDEALLDRMGYARFGELIERYDLIVPIGEDMHVPVREHYAAAPFHHGEDLARMEEIVRTLSPEYGEAMEAYLSGTVHYFGNIFIMTRELYHRYCAWLFPLLEEFDRQTDTSAYGPQEKRLDGYLAERLLGVFYTRHRDELRTLELPRVHFDAMDGKPDRKKRLLYKLLPPGSRRRSLVKELHTKQNHG